MLAVVLCADFITGKCAVVVAAAHWSCLLC